MFLWEFRRLEWVRSWRKSTILREKGHLMLPRSGGRVKAVEAPVPFPARSLLTRSQGSEVRNPFQPLECFGYWKCGIDPSRNNSFIVSHSPISPSTPKFKKFILSTFQREKRISEVVRLRGIIIFHLSKLWKAKFFILCDVMYFWWRCRGNLTLITCNGSAAVNAQRSLA